MTVKTLLLTAAVASFASTATAQISELSELSEQKTYTIVNGRGGIITTGTDATQCSLKAYSSGNTEAPSADDANNTWVVIQSPNYTSTYYLYNVGSQKFLYPNTGSTQNGHPYLSSTADCATQRFTLTKDAKSETINDVTGTYNFKIVPVSQSSWCLAISGGMSNKFGFGATSQFGTDAGGRFNFTEASTIDESTLTQLKASISSAEESYKLSVLNTKISSLKSTLNTYAGKVGYPTSEAYATFTSAVDATDATYDTKTAAINALLVKANIALPTDGKAYYIHPVNKGASSNTTYYLYTNDNGVLHFTQTKDNRAIFYAHKVGEKFVFTNCKGKYMTFRADGQTAAGQTNGVLSEYDEVCQFSILPFYFSGTSESTTNSNVTSATIDYLGLTLLQGYMVCPTDSRYTGNHYLMVNTSQSSSANPFHNGPLPAIYYTASGNTCAYYFEEADQENGFKATEMKVNDETLYLGSYSSPFPVVLPDGLTAYTVSQADETATLSPIEGQVIPASTGVIIKANDNNTYIPTARTTEDLPTVEGNKLQASTGAAVADDTNAYILGFDSATRTANFYLLSSTDRTIKLYKSYLVIDAASANKMVLNFNGATTGIHNATSESSNASQPAFDLCGRRVSQPTKGLYIMGGKKVLVK